MTLGPGEIKEYILKTFPDVHAVDDEGNWFFFCDTENKVPFATIVVSDKYDSYSKLDRDGAFRLNIGSGKDRFRSMFPIEERPLDAGFDFTAEDQLMPHPEYGRIFWVCVVNPGDETWQRCKPLVAEAYQIAVRKFTAARARKSG